MAGRHRELELDDARYVGRALDALVELLSGRNHLTRTEIGALGDPRLPEAGSRLGHLLLLAELRGLICSGPTKGVHHSYAVVDEVVAPTPERDPDDALASLVHRFFAGHGPASAHDFARWSSLTLSDTRRGIDVLGGALECVEVEGTPLWFDPTRLARRRRDAPEAWLFPTYDEVVLTYPSLNFEPADGHPQPKPADPFWARVVHQITNVGAWKRTVTKNGVEVRVQLARSVGADTRSAVQAAAQRLADFLGRPLAYESA